MGESGILGEIVLILKGIKKLRIYVLDIQEVIMAKDSHKSESIF